MGRRKEFTLQTFEPYKNCACQCGNTHELYGGKGFDQQDCSIVQEGPDTSGYYISIYNCRVCGKEHLVFTGDPQYLPKLTSYCPNLQMAVGYNENDTEHGVICKVAPTEDYGKKMILGWKKELKLDHIDLIDYDGSYELGDKYLF